jgi:sec-independent protein translocase protein TatA
MGLSTTEILVIVILVLVLFGAKKIPELARSLGRASYEFKKAKEDLVNDAKEAAEAGEKAAEKEAEEAEKK